MADTSRLTRFIKRLRGDEYVTLQVERLSREITTVGERFEQLRQNLDPMEKPQAKTPRQSDGSICHTNPQSIALQSTGERQVGTALDEIEQRHRLRYYFAAYALDTAEAHYGKELHVADIGCGVGYGTSIVASMMPQKVATIDAFDISADAIGFAKVHYPNPKITYHVQDCRAALLQENPTFARCTYDVITCFEFLEHVTFEESCELIDLLLAKSRTLITSFPIDNASVFHKIRIGKAEIEDYYQSAIQRCRSPKRVSHAAAQDGRYYVFVIEDAHPLLK